MYSELKWGIHAEHDEKELTPKRLSNKNFVENILLEQVPDKPRSVSDSWNLDHIDTRKMRLKNDTT